MITLLFGIAMACALVSGFLFFSTDSTTITTKDKISAGLLGIACISLVVIAYIAGAK